jgi:hypothetical protein
MSGSLEAPVEAQFAVGELAAPGLDVIAQQLPEDRAGHALDQVVVVDEHAVVGGEVPDRHRWTLHGGGGRRVAASSWCSAECDSSSMASAKVPASTTRRPRLRR